MKFSKEFNSTMDKNNDWNVEEFRTKHESEEHWKLKKDFMLAHKEKFNKERLICLAQIFVNVQLMRCQYPDQVMRQMAELSKGIGLDYKTIQRKRLQRTFVKASDAAAFKVKRVKCGTSTENQGSKCNYARTDCETEMNNDDDDGMEFFDNSESKAESNHRKVDFDIVSVGSVKESIENKDFNKNLYNLNSVSNFANLNASKVNPKHFPVNCSLLSTNEIKEHPKKQTEAINQSDIEIIEVSDSEIIEVSDSEHICDSKMESKHSPVESNFELNNNLEELKKKVDSTENEDNSVENKNSKLFSSNPNTCLVSCVYQEVKYLSKKAKKKLKSNSFSHVCQDLNEWYLCNIFLVLRNYAKFDNHSAIYFDSVRFSKINVENSYISFDCKNITCTLFTRMRGIMITLGEAVHSERHVALQNAKKNAVENFLKNCFTIQIKMKTCMGNPTTINNLNIQKCPQKSDSQNIEEQQKKKTCMDNPTPINNLKNHKKVMKLLSQNGAKGKPIDCNSIGARMLALMGWSGKGLGKNEDGIIEPLSFVKFKRRRGLGTKPKDFKGKIENIANKKKSDNLSTVDDVVKETSTKSKLSIKFVCSEKQVSTDCNVVKIFKLGNLPEADSEKNEKENKVTSVCGEEQVSTDCNVVKIIKLDDLPEADLGKNEKENKETSACIEEHINFDSIKAKMFKLMGLPEAELGKDLRENKDTRLIIQISCEDLGIKNENTVTEIFKIKVKSILDQVRDEILTTADGAMKETVFSSELSKEQRKYIHEQMRNPIYKSELKAESIGGENDRRLILRAKEDPRRLCCYLLSHGGSTEKYQIHAPGTLTVNYFLRQH